jgi:hypothetical protein
MKQRLHSWSWKCLFVLAAILCLNSSSYSQEEARNNTEAGITVGPMVFLGDLGGHAGTGTTFIKDWNMSTTKLAVGAYYTAYPMPWLGFRFSLNYGNIEGADNTIKPKGGDEVSRLNRNLDFRSVIIEGTVMAEVYPTVFLEQDPEDVTARLRPYGVIGLGLFHFNPQGTYKSATGQTSWVDLQPLHTEGEGFPEYPNRKNYKLTQMNIPIGVGIKYYFSDNVNISFEIIHRKTFTDYIDDVSTSYIDPKLFYKYLSPTLAPIAEYMANKSPLAGQGKGYDPGNQRGNVSNKDAYFTAQFKLGIRIGGNTATRWRNSTHCPLLRF